ncbi:MAG: hypothetical protein ABW123_02930 [Cystobacter sp.]
MPGTTRSRATPRSPRWSALAWILLGGRPLHALPRKNTQGILWDYARVVLKTPSELLDAPGFEEAWNDTLDFTAE